MKTAAILLAGGVGKRVGEDIPKQFLSILDKPIIFYSLEVFDRCSEIDSIYLVLPDEKINYFKEELLPKFPISKLRKIVSGGETRQNSTFNGFQAIPKEVEIVVIHDVARPFVRNEMIRKSIFVAREVGSAIVASPATDTIKEVDENCRVQKTLDRKKLFQVQTPQTFRYSLLEKAFEASFSDNFQATDEAGLIERIGEPIQVIESDSTNLKITTPSDLVLAESLLKNFFHKGS